MNNTDSLRGLVENLQSARDRLTPVLSQKFGDSFDGDMDTILEAINLLKRLTTADAQGLDAAEPTFAEQALKCGPGWLLREIASKAAAPAAQVAELEHCDKCGYMTRNGAKCGCASPAVVVDEAGTSWMTDELIESAPRAKELAARLVAPGPKAASVSASETHEIADFIFDTVAALEAAALKGDVL